MHPSTPVSAATRLYLGYAALFLGVALGLGVWLRAVFVWPALIGGFSFQYLVHAHSHTAFFGWVTPALFGLIAMALPAPARERLSRRLRVHAHLLGLATALALVAFVASGYSVPAIALSAVHVVLWWVFALWLVPALGAGSGDGAGSEGPERDDGETSRRFYRAALVLLLVAGTATLLPGILMARGIHDGWLRELGVKLFLTPFLGGWIGLGAMGAVYTRVQPGRMSRWALRLTAIGIVPSTLLYVGELPPWSGLTWIGRGGSLLVGLGTLAFAGELTAARRPGLLLRLAGLAALLKGLLELLAGAGVGADLMHARPVVLAYLHLALLGVATPALLAARPWRAAMSGRERGAAHLRGPAAVGSHALGLALMCGALVGMGWPALAQALSRLGLGFERLLAVALGGGALSAVALVGLLLDGAAAPAPAAPRAAGPAVEEAAGLQGVS